MIHKFHEYYLQERFPFYFYFFLFFYVNMIYTYERVNFNILKCVKKKKKKKKSILLMINIFELFILNFFSS
jgi:hypothetical protein